MNKEQLDKCLGNFLEKYSQFRIDQTHLSNQLTMTQYKDLARLDVETHSELLQGIEKLLSDQLEILNAQIELKKKNCALQAFSSEIDAKFSQAAEKTDTRNKNLRAGNLEFIKSANEEVIFKKPAAPAPVFVPTEPTYQSRPNCEEIKRNALSAISKPQFESVKQQAPTPKHKPEINLDDSVINGHDISIVDENIRRRLKFDDSDDEKEEENVRVPIKTVISLPKTTPIDPSFLPPPPVFTSSVGRLFNKK